MNVAITESAASWQSKALSFGRCVLRCCGLWCAVQTSGGGGGGVRPVKCSGFRGWCGYRDSAERAQIHTGVNPNEFQEMD
jgi:hypothetical protein